MRNTIQWAHHEHYTGCCSTTVIMLVCYLLEDHLDGLVVKASTSRAGRSAVRIPLATGFSGSSHTSDSKIGTPVATLPGTWRYRVSAGTGRPGVSILWLGEVESLICSFYLSVAAYKLVRADPFLRYTRLLLGCKASNKQTYLLLWKYTLL